MKASLACTNLWLTKVPTPKGVYHQSKELERVLRLKHDVALSTFQHLPDPDPVDDDALYIVMPAFSASVFPPHYILYQTEQWGHLTLEPHSAVWPNKRENKTRQTTLDAFEVGNAGLPPITCMVDSKRLSRVATTGRGESDVSTGAVTCGQSRWCTHNIPCMLGMKAAETQAI